MSQPNFFNYWDSFLAWRMKSWPLSSVYSPCSDLIEDPVSVQRHAYSDSSEQQETQSHLFDLAKMIVGYLLLGVFALCGASRPPRRGAFAPAPEFTSDTPLIIEGDIAVTVRSFGSGTEMNIFRSSLYWYNVTNLSSRQNFYNSLLSLSLLYPLVVTTRNANFNQFSVPLS